MDRLLSIPRWTIGMAGNMRRGHRLTGSTGSRAGGTIVFDVTGSGMSAKRRLANNGHPKYPGIYPCLKCIDRLSRAMVFRVFFLKVRHDTLGTINRPDS